MRKLLIITGCALTGLLAAGAAALMLVDANQFRGPIQAQMEKSLHRKVALGNMGLKLLPLSIRVDDFAIAEDPAFATGKPFLSAKQIYVRAGLLALLQKRIQVESALLSEPAVELIKGKDGHWNFETVGAQTNSQPGSQSAIALQQLRLENGTVGVTDYQSGRPRAVYDRIALKLDNYVPGRRFTADGSAHLPGPKKEEVAAKLEGTTGGSDVDGSFSLKEVTAGPLAVSGEGTFRSRGTEVSGKSSLTAMDGRLKQPLRIDSTLQYDRASGKASVSTLELRLGTLAIRGSADVDTSADPIRFRADLRSDNAPLPEVLATANAFRLAEGVSGTGSVSMNLHVDGTGDALAYTGTMNLPNASVVPSPGAKPVQMQSANIQVASSQPLSGNVRAGKLVFDQIALSEVTSAFKYASGILDLDGIRARAFGGDIAGDMSVDTRGAGTKLAAKAKLSGVDANQLLVATTAVKVLSGRLSGDADLHLAPVPGQNTARGLSGAVRVLLTDGKISGIHLLDHLAQVGQFIGKTNTDAKNFTSISKLAGTMRIQSGVARTDDLQLDFDGGSLTATGTTDLASETLDLAVAALLTRDISQSVGGSKVGGFMTTVIANTKGELMIPAKVAGTFSKPRFLPDPSRLVKMRFGNANSAAATAQGLLEQFTKPKSGQQPGKESLADKAKPFTDLLNSLGKKK